MNEFENCPFLELFMRLRNPVNIQYNRVRARAGRGPTALRPEAARRRSICGRAAAAGYVRRG